jgi:benzodiazapine receptor
MEPREIGKIIIAIFVCQLAGIIGSVFTTSAIPEWYSTLVKPEFTPPSWLFAPVWITLYTLMGISLYLVWGRKDKKDATPALLVFFAQLVLNAVWSIVFFGLQSPFYAFIIIIFLWVLIAGSIYFFYPISKTAAYLMIPYILWVSFAALLNYFIWILNS